MVSNYLSFWIIVQFIIWSLGYVFKVDCITDYVNPYYSSIMMCIGYVIYMTYLWYKGYKFTTSFIILNTLAHFIPLYVSYKYVSNRYSVENLVIILLWYGIYMISIQKDPFTVYFLDDQPTSWKDLYKMLRLE